jgi:hypothetical protein
MPTDIAQEKQHVHELIDRLAPTQVTAVRGLLEAMINSAGTSVAIKEGDDEPLTTEDERALAEAAEWSKHHEPIPHQRVLAELGITQAEIENYRESA